MQFLRPLALAAAFAIVTAACGGGDDTSTGSSTTVETDETTSTTTAATPETTVSSADVADAADRDPDLKPVVVSPGGEPPTELVVNDLVVGDGGEAVSGTLVEVHYVGIRYSDGGQFDASWDRGQPFEFQIGSGNVIAGWDQGVAGMRVGGRRELTIPAPLAYGDRGSGEAIPPGETLIFVVDLLSVTPPPPEFPVPELAADGTYVIPNQGGEFEGNLPWNSDGAGPGLFAGDELNPEFPSDEGIEIFLTFNVDGVEVPEGTSVVRAELTSRAMQMAGTPFDDLGRFLAAPVDYSTFPPAGSERDPIGDGVECLSFAEEARLTCDVTVAVTAALSGDTTRSSFRLRFEEASDADGVADVAVFFFRDPNLNERGIFTLEIEFG